MTSSQEPAGASDERMPGSTRSSSQPTTPSSKAAQGSAPAGEASDSGPRESPRQHPPAPVSEDNPLRGSLTSGVWVATVGFGIVLVLLVIFIAQNTTATPVKFLGWQGDFPVAVVVLIAVAAGILLTAAAGTLRILQLRRRTKRGIKAQKKAARSNA
ncbi:LapA family protein [Nocardioides acrostichi]|uniref:DUF1049 domain-containing protein n=1 Tax=Nocardioides acrostichi TaxID=2784339 RepID=A0A930Y783_9ACTN|nr:lipopolysaccharide assembly protein LapA domain-containing protein [Nocardioides acrostichi]MBF4161721.1 DUF1049 domain-containing protein [Nocardioides acrostichi]